MSYSTPHRSEHLVVAPSEDPERFDSLAVDCPFVFTVDGRRGMTLVGWDGVGYQTGLCWEQADGSWSVPELVFPRQQDVPHRRYNTAITSLLRENGLRSEGRLLQVDGHYVATFHAYPSPGYESGPGVIGFARSTDLRSWEEFGPLIRPEEGGEWEQGGLYKSWIMRAQGRYWLFYNAKTTERRWHEQTGAAVSDDLLSWQRVSAEPLLPHGGEGAVDEWFASDPCVLEDEEAGRWVMFYFGLQTGGHARDLYATSPDLLHWTKGEEVLLDVGPAGSVDEVHAHKPAVIARDGALEHYYCAVSRRSTPLVLNGVTQPELRGIAVARERP
ncbi:family 43 glycosylhydrolase [Auraticoccus sp. F435]|uniref:Family 43 glycosylhydrolase n=1 Tax=Auraticoccus cholistanensis TaxID=2656650 RepID=A0A6A9UPV1_9ACTN|nr:family 43 glycosylhydrolase [Auraticoccus cholistanensis]MVA74711.1 family 43 glycosylhydrolase [Auraticoccus cholistanensis]